MIYRRGGVWWYKFRFGGQQICESTRQGGKTIATEAERTRRSELANGFNGITRQRRGLLFSSAAETWLKSKTAHLSARSVIIERANLKHLLPAFGKLLMCDVTADTIGAYQSQRLREKASPKTINLELGTVRAILRKQRMWAAIQPDVRMLTTREDIGRALSQEEEAALLRACGESRSRSLLPAVTLALSTAMRASEIRSLLWSQIDLARRTVIVGKSKTAAGTGRRSKRAFGQFLRL